MVACQSAEKMGELPMVLLLAGIGCVIAEDPIEINVQLGSDLHLPVADACQFDGTYHLDIYRSTQWIGTYDGELKPFNGYKGRLTYNSETCDLTLKNLTDQDGTSFRVTLKENINSSLQPHDIKYRINIRVTEDTRSARNVARTSGQEGFVAVLSSLLVIWILHVGT